MAGQLIRIGSEYTLADKIAPESATLAWYEDLGDDLENLPRWVDIEFSKRAFAAVAAAEGKSVTQVFTMTGKEVHDMLELLDRRTAIIGAALNKTFLFQFA